MSETYKLINDSTKEEHICNKVIIDGFDYYTSVNIQGQQELNYNYGLNKIQRLERDYEIHSSEWNFCREIIATNNTSIDLPQIEVHYDYDELGELMLKDGVIEFEKKHGYSLPIFGKGEKPYGDYLYFSFYEVFNDILILHYGERTRHDCPYSVTLELPLKDSKYPIIKTDIIDTNIYYNQDMIEFANFCTSYCNKHGHKHTEELLDLWESQRPKIIYFN